MFKNTSLIPVLLYFKKNYLSHDLINYKEKNSNFIMEKPGRHFLQ